MKPLVIGQAPSRTCSVSFGGRSGEKIARLAGISHAEFLERTERVNLIAEYLGKDGRGDRAPMRLLRAGARRLIDSGRLDEGRVLIVGYRVLEALLNELDELIDVTAHNNIFSNSIAIPHPSGLNRFYNKPDNCRDAAKSVRWALLRKECRRGRKLDR